MSSRELSEMSMDELFRIEAETQTQTLTAGLLALEREPMAADQLEICMRAAHSLKGAARIVDLAAGVTLAHAMEDCFVAAQKGQITFTRDQIDLLLKGVDLLMSIAASPDLEPGSDTGGKRAAVDRFIEALNRELKADASSAPLQDAAPQPAAVAAAVPATPAPEPADRALRVSVDNLNYLLSLAGETLVESRWLKPFGNSLLRLKRMQANAGKSVARLRELPTALHGDDRAQMAVESAQASLLECQRHLSECMAELELSDRRFTNLAHRLYDQALACRMRPFNDGILAFPRSVRDLGRSLGKPVRLNIEGADTQIDRDILERLEAPLGHLLRNAIDHGIEGEEERRAAGKPAEGVIELEAYHRAGMLLVTVSDDGRGIDLEKLRGAVVARRLVDTDTAAKLSESELLEFLFLPGFSTKESVTDISGRGVGLDVVRDMIKHVGGVVRVFSDLGKGTQFQLQLPLTLSVIRALLVDVGGEPYAFPLSHIVRAVKVAKDEIEVLEGRQHFPFDGQHVGLVSAHQLFEVEDTNDRGAQISVVVVCDQNRFYGVAVDGFLGSRELVVKLLDPRLGKVRDISAAAVMPDGSPVLIVDVEDMICSMEKLASSRRLAKVGRDRTQDAGTPGKRVLIVDDSLTVRELERKLLQQRGYDVEVAVDGADGWNAVRAGRYDLVISDVDMPRMDGIELVTRIKQDSGLKSLPVMIVSYKDREEDRRRGLDAGADYYLTKASFHDATLLDAVVDLIGEAAT